MAEEGATELENKSVGLWVCDLGGDEEEPEKHTWNRSVTGQLH